MLNPALNPATLASEYPHKHRLLIRDILAPEAAARIEHCLQKAVPWGLAVLENDAQRDIPAGELKAMSPAEWERLATRVHASARTEFQFMFNNYQMVKAYLEKRDPGLFLHQVIEFLNSPPMLEFVCQVTGHADIGKADAQATRYLPGHFLRRHDDRLQYSSSDVRRTAYVLNLTRHWEPDWGGQLQFLNDNTVAESWVPSYNTLALFSVPSWHCVSPVAVFATAPRLAITGWFRTHSTQDVTE